MKFNPVETNLLGAAASDNSIILYDIRNVGPVRKVVMNLRSNALAWNPMEVKKTFSRFGQLFYLNYSCFLIFSMFVNPFSVFRIRIF